MCEGPKGLLWSMCFTDVRMIDKQEKIRKLILHNSIRAFGSWAFQNLTKADEIQKDCDGRQ